ncbi:hypothetical protein ACIFQM_01110 [Paenibacillus sp. NRS-1782]|uniref:hypothetical protein n=1 Tax=unclassified Paenibacillus TaxID=185978 RepID=UPI003D28BD91
MRPFKSMSGAELVIAAYDESKDYDYRIEAAKEIYRRAGVPDARGIQQTKK